MCNDTSQNRIDLIYRPISNWCELWTCVVCHSDFQKKNRNRETQLPHSGVQSNNQTFWNGINLLNWKIFSKQQKEKCSKKVLFIQRRATVIILKTICLTLSLLPTWISGDFFCHRRRKEKEIEFTIMKLKKW